MFYVHFNYAYLENTPPLSEGESNYQDNMDNTAKSSFNIHVNDHTVVKFLKYGPWPYYLDTAKSKKSTVDAYSFLYTFKDDKSYVGQCKIKGADRDREIQGKIGFPYVQYYQNILSHNQIIDTRVTVYDINRYEAIYGPRVAMLKQRMFQKPTTCTEHATHPTTHPNTIPPQKLTARSTFHVLKLPHNSCYYII